MLALVAINLYDALTYDTLSIDDPMYIILYVYAVILNVYQRVMIDNRSSRAGTRGIMFDKFHEINKADI